MVSTEFKGVGLHYTAFRDAIREDSRQTTPSRGITPQKKFAVEANVESRVKIPGVVGFPYGRNVTGFRWQLHRGMEEDDGYYSLYRPEQPEISRLEKIQGALPMFQTGGCYFETFAKSLDMKRFPCTFQDADVKPWGRWWLKEYAFALAKTDALKIVAGEQPLHTLGNETEIREFARAYRPLPARPFATVVGSGDPVTVRVLETKDGLYLYAVNIHHTSVSAVLPKEMKGTELSDGTDLTIGRIALRGSELRSFFIPRAKAADVSSFRVELSDASRHAYDRRLEVLEKACATFDAHGLSHEKEDAIVECAVKAWRAGALNQAHQEFFRKELNGMIAKLDNLEYVVAEARLAEKGIFRVNCGQAGWEMIEGDLFSPDKSWDGVTYGHVIFKRRSGQNSSARDTTRMKRPVKYAKVFETEAFDVDEYVFNVQRPGRYRLTLYMKTGWRAAMVPNWFHTEVLANGKPLFEPYLDLYEAQGRDFDRPVVKTAEVEVGVDGLLRLELKCPSEYYLFMLRKPNTTTRLMNAITVERLD